MHLSKKQIEEIRHSCRKLQVKSLFAFGSVVSDTYRLDSDIDMLVDFTVRDPLEYADRYFTLKQRLELILNRPVDLLESKALKNPFLQAEIDRSKVSIYG
ncbi:MAG: nucleotidyltransferase [Candidatus Marinimicrobia bacterium CG08_land_8_20_14_0_20_45_22]|nr:MAG: nucleotidyltransferase [Candidatus Marinimicrobia bacterium CG08_land_8_20_14_0_20_45_22]